MTQLRVGEINIKKLEEILNSPLFLMIKMYVINLFLERAIVHHYLNQWQL